MYLHLCLAWNISGHIVCVLDHIE